MKILQRILQKIDHKGYPAYKETRGKYNFDEYILSIDHVQGDPFAAPSSLSIVVSGQSAELPADYYKNSNRKTALEDFLLRKFSKELDKISFKAKGSGKSGIVYTSHPGQEVLERTACNVNHKTGDLILRFKAGFPARGRTICAQELERLLYDYLPEVIKKSCLYRNIDKKQLEHAIFLADDYEELKKQVKKKGLIAFVSNGAILPRESGVSDKPMKDAIPFTSPKTMEVEINLPHAGSIKGMGIKKGVTLIVGGGYHGKSTLLKTLEKSVYQHIAGDGREYIVTDCSAMKIRAEDGRSVCDEDISMFIQNLPNGKNTKRFSTLDASGSTSQAANTIEAIQCGSKVLLIDEDTSATNFMVRDELMERVIDEKKDPIIPFIKRAKALYNKNDISTILVVGSCGAFFEIADYVIQMDKYLPKDITEKAKSCIAESDCSCTELDDNFEVFSDRKIKLNRNSDRNKIKVNGTDGFVINKKLVDLRYLEQITNDEQMLAIAKALELLQDHYGEREIFLTDALQYIQKRLEDYGVAGLCQKGVVMGLEKPRIMEINGCINRALTVGIRTS